MVHDLQGIAKRLGIATKFVDAGMIRREYEVSDETLRFFINSFGYDASNDEAIANSLHRLENARWHQALENIYIVEAGNVSFDVVVPASWAGEYFDLEIFRQNDAERVDVSYEVVNEEQSAFVDGQELLRLQINIKTTLNIGYYDVRLNVKNKHYKTLLAVAPKRCYEAPAMAHKLWGFSIQLYSVKSDRNWGVGDFTDLCSLAKICARSGAQVIGLNPLNVLMHNFPENASPYSSISRLFLNPIYIDVEEVPEFTLEDKYEVEGRLEELRSSELIQYSEVYPLKIKMLERCYNRFLNGGNKERLAAYKQFCKEQGKDLEKLAAFQTLYEDENIQSWGGWRAWPEEYRHPDSPAVKAYVKEHKLRVDFFKFLQFEADRQFNKAQGLVKELGLGVGFYRDLAVGVGKDSAELWSQPELFFADAGAGAPPDAFFPAGQKWCLGAFNPFKLKENRYEAFIKILRANMKNAGALRIDHVMSLMRLYLIPDEGEQGTYVFYNFADMLNLVALESHLNRCAVVGESIGNVPEGFLEILAERNIHPLSVLWSERYDAGWGDFAPPSAYPKAAFASVGTHDMAPLRMWWFGYDIELSYLLGLIPDEQGRSNAYHKRELDRWKLLSALDDNGVWPEDNQRKSNYIYGEGYPEGIEEAVNRFMSRCASQVFLAQPEDILHVEKMQNLPGTDRDKHPNWRRKLPVSLERLETDIAYVRNIAAIKRER